MEKNPSISLNTQSFSCEENIPLDCKFWYGGGNILLQYMAQE